VEVTETTFDSASDKVKSVVNEKTGEVSVESPQDEDTEYVKGHPVIRNGTLTLLSLHDYSMYQLTLIQASMSPNTSFPCATMVILRLPSGPLS
jgi:hypothetical protein